MKKITISFISLAVIVLAAVLVVNHSYSAKNPLLTEITSALADDPNTGDEECPDDPNGGGSGTCPRGGSIPNLKCLIWKVIYSQGGMWPTVTCETDPNQSYKCNPGTCPHGN